MTTIRELAAWASAVDSHAAKALKKVEAKIEETGEKLDRLEHERRELIRTAKVVHCEACEAGHSLSEIDAVYRYGWSNEAYNEHSYLSSIEFNLPCCGAPFRFREPKKLEFYAPLFKSASTAGN